MLGHVQIWPSVQDTLKREGKRHDLGEFHLHRGKPYYLTPSTGTTERGHPMGPRRALGAVLL